VPLKEHVQEIREGALQGEAAVLEKISKFQEPDRSIGKKIHEIIRKSAPEFVAKTLVRDACLFKRR